jgi:predicted ArsR family transcriptional regulator
MMRETRQAILESIKRKGSTTVNEIAEEMSLSPVTVRHHLYAAMADGLIERISLRRGVGRPEHGYSLTEAGQRLFPSRYHVLTTHLLNVLKSLHDRDDVEHMLEVIVRQLLDAPEQNDALTPRERLRQLEEHFQNNDIPIRIAFVDGDEAHLELRCPYYYVSQHHPELCSIDERVIEDFLRLPMERTGCLLNGDKSCSFSIKLVEEAELSPTPDLGNMANSGN